MKKGRVCIAAPQDCPQWKAASSVRLHLRMRKSLVVNLPEFTSASLQADASRQGHLCCLVLLCIVSR